MKSKRKMGIKAFCINFLIAFLVFIPYIIQGNGTLAICDDFNLQKKLFNLYTLILILCYFPLNILHGKYRCILLAKLRNIEAVGGNKN